jgi:RNA polymerase sigma factor (sigma-70 family)
MVVVGIATVVLTGEMMEPKDSVLVERCQKGDKSAFSLLVTRHWLRVKRVLWAVLPQATDVDDLLQEAFLQAYLGLDTLRQPDRFRAWVCGIAINLARMRWRRASRHRWLYWDELEGSGIGLADGRPSPERVAEQRETVDRLNQAIADLPPSEREALLLVYGNGLTHRETAERLGASVGAVKVRVHRGRRRLRASLQTDYGLGPSRAPENREVEVTMIEVDVYDVLAQVRIGESSASEDEPESEPSSAVECEGFIGPAFKKDLDVVGPHRVVLLKEKTGDRVLPIWIGPCEGDAIVIKLVDESMKRPISADLTKTLLDLGGVEIERVAVSRLHEQIFYSTLTVRTGNGRVPTEVDCRPSDALTLAVRMDVPVYVAGEVMGKAGISASEEGQYLMEKEPPPGTAWQSLLARS